MSTTSYEVRCTHDMPRGLWHVHDAPGLPCPLAGLVIVDVGGVEHAIPGQLGRFGLIHESSGTWLCSADSAEVLALVVERLTPIGADFTITDSISPFSDEGRLMAQAARVVHTTPGVRC